MTPPGRPGNYLVRNAYNACQSLTAFMAAMASVLTSFPPIGAVIFYVAGRDLGGDRRAGCNGEPTDRLYRHQTGANASELHQLHRRLDRIPLALSGRSKSPLGVGATYDYAP